MARMNWAIVELNLTQAREELERLERMVADRKARSKIKFQVGLCHAYHHLNFAWNARHATNRHYGSLSTSDFKRWGRYPRDVERF